MEDSQIIDLYWARSEQAVQETDTKYGSYCRAIADAIKPAISANKSAHTHQIWITETTAISACEPETSNVR